MSQFKPNEKSEQLREALLDLERANAKERDLRLETETLLAGLNVLTNFDDREKMFSKMLAVLRNLINFEDAFILTSNEKNLQLVASTSDRFKNMTWRLDKAMTRISIGKPLAFFDVSAISEWQEQPAAAKQNVCSALHVLLRDHPNSAILICTHSAKGFFVEKHLRLSTRFAPLASQALTNLDSMRELEKINNLLQVEISERQKAQAQVVNNSKMAALGEMAGGVAHEINTPLAIIQMRMEQLGRRAKDGDIDTDAILKTVDIVDKTVSRISKIILGLRAFAADGQRDPYQKILITNIFDDTLSLCREKFTNHGIDLRVKISEDLKAQLEVECRSTEISQVLVNLLNNSYDAVEKLSDKWIHIEALDAGNFIEISVTDSGSGIPTELQEKIMQPFFSTKEIGKGTGLGLSISKGIIDRHKGRISIDNNCKNTKIVVFLPKQQIAS